MENKTRDSCQKINLVGQQWKLYNCMNTDGVILVKSKRPTEIFFWIWRMHVIEVLREVWQKALDKKGV